MASSDETKSEPTHPKSQSPSPQPLSVNTNGNGDARYDADAKIPQKREREVSQEPATPRTDDLEADSDRPRRDARTPAKKNRTQLGVTQEEDGDTEDDAPVSGSPPHETKMRQISQGVEDINWINRHKLNQPSLEGDAMSTDVPQPPSPNDVPVMEIHREHEDAGPSTAAAGAVQAPPSPQPSVMDLRPDEVQASEPPPTSPPSRRSSQSESETDKNLKRKLADRAPSQGPMDVPKEPKARKESVDLSSKRPRDDADEDVNPRETKRPSPPPDKPEPSTSALGLAAFEPNVSPNEIAKPTPTPALAGGFLAYASTTSPFASVKGPNLFASGKAASTSKAPSPWSGASGRAPLGTSIFGSAFTSSSPPTPAPAPSQTPLKRSGFEAFAATAARPKSPLGLARSKSPVRRGTPGAGASVFSSYAAGGAQAFAVPVAKRARAGSPGEVFGEVRRSVSVDTGTEKEIEKEKEASGSGSGVSREGSEEESAGEKEKEKGRTFGERLRAGRDEEEEEEASVWGEKKTGLTAQEVVTGEEEEKTVHHVRGKLFVLSPQNQWKERGTGTIRLNVPKTTTEDGGRARLVMRKEAVYTVLLNVTLFRGMSCFIAQDPRYLRFSVIENGVTTHYNLRVSNAKAAADLLRSIQAHIPDLPSDEVGEV